MHRTGTSYQSFITFLRKIGFSMLVFKTALAAAISWWVASLFTPEYPPYLAPIAAVLIVNITVASTLTKAFYRIIGVIYGVLISLIIGYLVTSRTLAIFLSVLLGTALTSAFRLNNQIVSQVGVSAVMALAFLNTPFYGWGRIAETILGCLVAVLVNAVIAPSNNMPKAAKSIRRLSEISSNTLSQLSLFWISDRSNVDEMLGKVRSLFRQTEKSFAAIELAIESIRYRPFTRKIKNEIDQLGESLSRLEHITVQIRGIARGMADLHYNDSWLLNDHKLRSSLHFAMQTTAACITLYGHAVVNRTEDAVRELDQAISLARLKQKDCVTILHLRSITTLNEAGAILNDLNRILREVSASPLVKTGKEY